MTKRRTNCSSVKVLIWWSSIVKYLAASLLVEPICFHRNVFFSIVFQHFMNKSQMSQQSISSHAYMCCGAMSRTVNFSNWFFKRIVFTWVAAQWAALYISGTDSSRGCFFVLELQFRHMTKSLRGLILEEIVLLEWQLNEHNLGFYALIVTGTFLHEERLNEPFFSV